MRQVALRTVAGLAFAATTLAMLVPLSGARAQGAVRGQYGDWLVRCETPAGLKTEQCALAQRVVDEFRSNVSLDVYFLKTADKKTQVLRVVAPLGVLLPSRLGLKIDQTDIGRTEFTRCYPTGCYAEVEVDDALLQKFNTGKTATFIIFQTPEEGIGIPITLDKFAEGFQKLP